MDPDPLPAPFPRISLHHVVTDSDIELAKTLFQEYANSLGVDMSYFQGLDEELASLPGDYALPDGVILLARVDGQLAGCGAVRPLADCDYVNACEMQHLYVRMAFRRFGLGRHIAESLLEHAQNAGYSVMLLDTMDEMAAARGLYRSLGFNEIPPYYYNPLPGTQYLKVDLNERDR